MTAHAHRSALVAAAALWLGCGGAPDGPVPESARRVVVAHDTGASALAAALTFPGSGWELLGTEGLTLLAAHTLLEPARGPLAALGARAEVECERGVFTFTMVAPAPDGATALDVLLNALFRPAPTQASLDSARSRLQRSLSLGRSSPAGEARLVARQALHGDSLAPSAWEAPACGIPETLPLFELADIRAGAYRFAPRMARAAILGPEGADSIARSLRARLPATAPPPLPTPTTTHAGRHYLERNTITAWTAHAYPFRAGADVEALHFLGTFLEHSLGPGVDRPEVLTVSYEVERHGGGGAFIVYIVTEPSAAPEYAERVQEALTSLTTGRVPRGLWERVAWRARGRRLLAHESPESRAGAMARALAGGHEPGDGWPEVDGVTLQRVRAAAASLGPPARAVVGPRSARAALTP